MSVATGFGAAEAADGAVTSFGIEAALAFGLLDEVEAGLGVGKVDVCLVEPSLVITVGGATVLAGAAFAPGVAADAVVVKGAVWGTAATTTWLPASLLLLFAAIGCAAVDVLS